MFGPYKKLSKKKPRKKVSFHYVTWRASKK